MALTDAERRELEALERGVQAAAPAAPQESGLRSRARALAQGATAGFQDELAGLAGAAASVFDPRVQAGPGEVYRDIQQAEQGAQNQFSEAHPAQNMALQMAGGIASPLSRLMPPGVPAAAGPAAHIGQQAATGAAQGAAYGALYGAGNAQGTGALDTTLGATGGGVMGALMGGALGGGIAGAQELWHKLAPGVKGRMVAMGKSLGMGLDELADRLREFGPAGTLADVTRGTRDAAGAAASRLGVAKSRIASYQRRSEQAFGRLMEPITRALGDRAAGVQTEAQLRAVLKHEASPLYQEAFRAPIHMTAELRNLWGRPSMQAAWRQAQRVGADDLDVPLAALKGEGTLPSFQGWQYITELLYDRGSALARAGKNKAAAVVFEQRQAVLRELDRQSPRLPDGSSMYARARALWAGGKRAEDAMEAGQRFMNSSVDDVMDAVSQMDPGALHFYRMGVGRSIQAKLETIRDANDITRGLQNPAFRAKLETALGDRRIAADFINSARIEAEFQATYNQLANQSATAGRQAMAKQIGGAGDFVAGAVEQAGAPSLFGAAHGVVKKLTGPRGATMDRIGDLLTSNDPLKKQYALRLMREESVSPQDLSRVYFLLGQQAGQVGD
jgi:hypothetical protein